MGYLNELIANETGAYVHTVELGGNWVADEFQGFFGDVDDQIQQVCAELGADERLRGGFNAIGLSQGGQFLRGLVQRCNFTAYGAAGMQKLISIGGQHQGVYGLPNCPGANVTLCGWVREALDKGAYLYPVQRSVVPAQYWQDPFNYTAYGQKNTFLADINQVRKVNPLYKERLSSLAALVLVMFEGDTVVQPPQSEWFGFYAPGSGNVTVPLYSTPIWKNDTLGLHSLKAGGRLHFLSLPGDHLRFTKEWFVSDILKEYLMSP
jgi:palmitoyl-protein thioesterase